MNAARTARPPSTTDDLGENSDLLSNPSYDIITGDVGQFTTQYYHTVETPEGVPSPKDGEGGSSSDSSCSGRSKTTSTSSDDGGHRKHETGSPLPGEVQPQRAIVSAVPPTLEYPGSQQGKVAVPMCGGVSVQGGADGSSVKHWSYEEQFKQVRHTLTHSHSPLTFHLFIMHHNYRCGLS